MMLIMIITIFSMAIGNATEMELVAKMVVVMAVAVVAEGDEYANIIIEMMNLAMFCLSMGMATATALMIKVIVVVVVGVVACDRDDNRDDDDFYGDGY